MATWDAADYHHHSTGQQIWARELIPKLALSGTERLLDVGCGDGKITAEIAQQLPHGSVVGIDSSEEMVAFARRTFLASQYPRLTFLVMDARALRFTEPFDVVFSNATLHWLQDHRPVLAGIARLLTKGGRALLQMGGRGNAAAVVQVVAEITAKAEWSPWFAGFRFPYGFFDPQRYRRWSRQAGLSVERAELVPKDMAHDGLAGLAGWLRTTWLPYLERVPEERRTQFVDEIVTRYCSLYPPDAEGKVHVQMVRLEVALRRAGC